MTSIWKSEENSLSPPRRSWGSTQFVMLSQLASPLRTKVKTLCGFWPTVYVCWSYFFNHHLCYAFHAKLEEHEIFSHSCWAHFEWACLSESGDRIVSERKSKVCLLYGWLTFGVFELAVPVSVPLKWTFALTFSFLKDWAEDVYNFLVECFVGMTLGAVTYIIRKR